MIILYEYTETAFTNNGLGCLNDATSCSVKETLNGEYELEMEYPVNGIHYSDIQLRRIILAKPNSYDQTQPFRIYSISKPIGGLVTVNAEHISYDMSGLPVRGAVEHYAWYVNDVFEHIRNNSVYPCPFTFSSDITEEKKDIGLSKPRSVKAFLGTDEGLLSLFGGEWEFDRYNAILHKERGQNRGVSIEYGKNLTDVTQDEKCSEMYTAVYPYYYQEDDGLQRLDDDVVKILDTPYKNVYVLDLSSEFDEMPTQDQLRAKTQEYIKENKLAEPKVSLKVSFIKNPEVIEALQDVRLGDTVGVKFIKIGVDTTSRCISYDFNVLTEQYNSIELGEPTKTIVDTMTSTSNRIDAANSAIDDEIDRATGAEGVLSTRIDKTDSDITLEVSRAQGAEESLGSRITLTEESITAEATRAQGAEGNLSSQISIVAGEVSSKVSRGDVVSEINQTADTISLRAGHLEIDCNNFQVDKDTGDAKIGGTLSFYEDFSESYSGGIQYGKLPGGGSMGFNMNSNLNVSGDIFMNQFLVAKKADIPDMSKYVTSSALDNKLTNYINDLDAYADSDKGTTFYYSLQHNGHTLAARRRAINTSDERLKVDILPLDDLTDIYMSFEPISYHFNPGLGGYEKELQYGLSAQKIEKAFKEHGIMDNALVWKVAPDKDFHEDIYTKGDLVYHLDKDQLHAMHIQMIQKQQREIKSLKLENFQIKGELDLLKQRLKIMEEKLC